MNILFVYNTAITSSQGGTERVTRCIANALQQAGYSIFFMTIDASPSEEKNVHAPNHFLIKRHLDTETKIKQVRDICKQHRIKIIINEKGDFDNFSIFSNRVLPNIKIISCLHFDVMGRIKNGKRWISNNIFKRIIYSALLALGIDLYRIKRHLNDRSRYRKMLEVSDAVVVVTPIIAKELKQLTHIHPEKIISIYNPLSFTTMHPHYNENAKEKIFLYVGRLAHEKNVDKLLKAWGKIADSHSEWTLEIAGSGILQKDLEAIVINKKIPRVTFHGHVENIEELYNKAEYLCLPSSHESFSCVVLESMAYGCHPIVFDYPSAPVVIPNARLGTRIKHSTRALAKAMSTAIKNNTSNRHNIDEISKHLAGFDINKLSNEWQLLLKRITRHHATN